MGKSKGKISAFIFCCFSLSLSLRLFIVIMYVLAFCKHFHFSFYYIIHFILRYGPHFEDVQRVGQPTNLTVQAGSSIHLNCRISLLQDKTVSVLSCKKKKKQSLKKKKKKNARSERTHVKGVLMYKYLSASLLKFLVGWLVGWLYATYTW